MVEVRVTIGFPTGNRQQHECVAISLLKMMSGRDWSDWKFDVLTESGMYIDVNRNNIVRKFIEKDSEFLLFWDSDNGLTHNAIPLLLENFNDPNINIVGGMYQKKEPFTRWTFAICQDENDIHYYPLLPTRFKEEQPLVNLSKDFGSVRGYVGTGVMMIRRVVLERLTEPWFRLRWVKSGMNHRGKDIKTHMTEDVYFCEKAQKAGFDIHLDTRVCSPHYEGVLCYPHEWRQYHE